MLFTPVEPPTNPDQCESWLYEAIKRLNAHARQSTQGFGAILRGEAPDASGNPLGLVLPNFPGALLFVGPGPVLAVDQTKLFWDNTNDRLGIGVATPTARLHVVGYPSTIILPASESGGIQQWDNIGGFANRGLALATDDGATSYISRTRVGGIHTCLVNWSSAISSTQTSWTLTYVARMTIASFDPTDVVRFKIYRSDGVEYISTDIFPQSAWTTSFATYTVTVSTLGTTGTANTLKVEADLVGTGSGQRLDITYVSLPTGGSGGDTVVFQAAASQTDTLTEWQDSSGTVLLSVSNAGVLSIGATGGFQLVSGAGLGKLLTSSASGVASWTTPDLLSISHGDTLAGTVVAGDIIIGNATPKWARLAKGNNGEILSLVAGLPAWTALSALSSAEFLDSAFRVIGSAGPTKKLAFEVDGLSVGTRTLTPQDADYIIAGTNLVQTFTRSQVFQSSADETSVFIQSANITIGPTAILNVSEPGGIDVFQVSADGFTNFTQMKLHAGSIGLGADLSFDPANLTGSRTMLVPDISATHTMVARTGTIANNRVPFFNASNATASLITSSAFTFTTGTATLSVTNIAAHTATGNLTFADAINVILNGTTGTKIATATTQKLGFWNAAPIVQPTTAVAAATFVANSSGIVDDSATFDSYTIGQVVKALRNAGLLA